MFGIRWFVIGSLALISGGTALADDTSKSGGWYVIVDEEGNAVVPEQVDLSTDTVTGWYAVVDERGNAYVPELVGAPDGDTDLAGTPEQVCCAIVGVQGRAYVPELVGAPGSSSADVQPEAPDFALTANGRSIALIESKEAPIEFGLAPHHPF